MELREGVTAGVPRRTHGVGIEPSTMAGGPPCGPPVYSTTLYLHSHACVEPSPLVMHTSLEVCLVRGIQLLTVQVHRRIKTA